jgi:DNA-binding MurR/RpiR family transcriptional regulator
MAHARAETGDLDSRPALNGRDLAGGVLAGIRVRAASLPASGRKVTDYIDAHPAEFIHLPIAELASVIGVSTTTIARTSQALGFSGLRELKYAIALDAGRYEPVLDAEVSEGDRAIDIARNVFQSSIAALSGVAAIMNDENLETIATCLLNANRIEFFAAAFSSAVALDAHYRMSRLGLPTSISLDPLMQAAAAARLGPGDVAFAVSTLGRTAMVIRALEIAKERGATTVLLTGLVRSPSARIADHVLVVPTKESNSGSLGTITRLAELTMLDALALICAFREPKLMQNVRTWPETNKLARIELDQNLDGDQS